MRMKNKLSKGARFWKVNFWHGGCLTFHEWETAILWANPTFYLFKRRPKIVLDN